MSEPEIKVVVDEHGNIEYRVTNEGVLLSKDEKEFIASHILHLYAENEKLRELFASYWRRTHSPAAPNVERDYLSEMRELGVEAG